MAFPRDCVTVSCSWALRRRVIASNDSQQRQPATMENDPEKALEGKSSPAAFYCAVCAVEVPDPLICGDCSAVICRRCGTSLESSDELGMG